MLHDVAVGASAVAVYLSGFRLVTLFIQEASTWIRQRRWPWVATSLLIVTGIVNLTQLVDQSLVGALGRNPGDLSMGHIWKLATPLLIQSDGVAQLISNTVCFVLVVPLSELVLGSWPVLALYFLSGLAGQAAGFAWMPHGGGNSVAIAGVLGSLYSLVLMDEQATWGMRLVAGLGIVAGAILAACSDNHGIAILTGALLNTLLVSGPRMRRSKAPGPASG